jgi:hypothetical protein
MDAIILLLNVICYRYDIAELLAIWSSTTITHSSYLCSHHEYSLKSATSPNVKQQSNNQTEDRFCFQVRIFVYGISLMLDIFIIRCHCTRVVDH